MATNLSVDRKISRPDSENVTLIDSDDEVKVEVEQKNRINEEGSSDGEREARVQGASEGCSCRAALWKNEARLRTTDTLVTCKR